MKQLWFCLVNIFDFFIEKVLGFIIPRAKGDHVIGYGKTISTIDWNSKKVTVITEVDQTVDTRMNDGKCDARGRLWFGKKLFTMQSMGNISLMNNLVPL